MNVTERGTIRSNRDNPMAHDVDDLDSILMDSFYSDQRQRLCHLNRNRPKRSHVTKPTTSNPQAKLNSINENSEKSKQCSYERKCENLNFEKSLVECLNVVKQPNIKLEEMDAVRLRSKKKSADQFNENDTSQTRSSVYFSDYNDIRSLDSSKNRNRMSMFEPNTYIAGPNHPTKYIEVFALENPKFDQEMFKKHPQRLKKESGQTKFKDPLPKFTISPKPDEDLYINGLSKTISPIPLFPVKPIVPMRFASPIRNDPPKQTPTELSPQIFTKISLKPALKQSIEIVQPIVPQLPAPLYAKHHQTQVKLRPRKYLKGEDENVYTPSKLANRFSMFESMSQKSFTNNDIRLNEYRPGKFEVGEETPKSIKERIKMFSK